MKRLWKRVRMPASMLGLLVLLGVVTGCGVVGVETNVPTPSPTAPVSSPTQERAVAPDFTGVTLDGAEVSLATFAGRPVALIFWATW